MSGVKSILKDKRGAASFPLTVAITLSLLLIFAGISEYLRLLIIAQGVRDAVQSSVIATVTENYDNVYHGAREGYSGAYQPMGGSIYRYWSFPRIKLSGHGMESRDIGYLLV